ncbi:MAG: hypothetical protein RLT05_32640, partial [Bauldia litoralis]
RHHDLVRVVEAGAELLEQVVEPDVYTAGEDPIPGADRDHLARGLRSHGHRNVRTLDKPEDLPAVIADIAGADDFVICLGAGSISQWAQALPGELEKIMGPGA